MMEEAQNQSIENKAKGLRLKDLRQTCWMCPSQWEGITEDGRGVYVRYRWGCLTVELDGPGGELIYCKHVGDDLDGFMTEDEMLDYTGMILV